VSQEVSPEWHAAMYPRSWLPPLCTEVKLGISFDPTVWLLAA
jgi:hypothetical protein